MRQEMMIDKFIIEISKECGKSPEFLKKALVNINIDNVADYYYSIKDEWTYSDFPNQRAPWIYTWGEYSILNELNSYIRRVGILRFEEQYNILQFNIFFEYTYHNIMPVPLLIMKLDECGAINDKYTRFIFKGLDICREQNEDEPELGARFFSKYLEPFLLANSFIHCKNIVLTEEKIDKKDNQIRTKRGKLPFFRFNTIQIDPMKEVLRKDGKSQQIGLKKALHICRGHFATYTKDAPLFGRVTGTFWKPMHLRGNKKEGVVIKDYKIKF